MGKMPNMENESIRMEQINNTMKIDQVYIINLNSSRSDIEARINQLGLPQNTPFFIMNAINGMTAESQFGPHKLYSNWKIESDNKWWNRDLTPGEIGCSLSHVTVWKDALAKGYNNILVLEEDFLSNGSLALKDLTLPANYDLLYLGRNKVDESVPEEEFGDFYMPSYSYNTHAYLLSQSGIKKLMAYNLQDNIIPADEFLSATFCLHPRQDIRELFVHPSIKAFALKQQAIGQIPTDIRPSTIEVSKPKYDILDASDWNLWKSKYIDKVMARGEYDLLVDEIGPQYSNIFEFPLFTQLFCDELIAMAEAENKWTEGRHEFYPTNDVLLQELGLGDIYKRVIREIITPLATHIWKLEGAWLTNPTDETFMIKYSMDKQGHLSLHHDHSYFTCGVKLNDEFDGGGTYFPKYGVCLTPRRNGNAFLHPGAITHKHGARPIHAGLRYIIVSFIRP
jgi:GR25 family glycosyltransferase involved in LPS biosynthesis